METASWVLLLSLIFSFCASGNSSIDNFHQAFPIVEPDPGHTKLRLSKEGLEAIERITTPIAAVAVIGPYRSGKSFLLNQLLSLSCYEGFGVGHMRDTKTKGIWVWGTPIEVDIDGVRTSVFYLDTGGFESVGKSNVYDDRIFALATVMSSVLVYNLPETIREADIARLSFAVELAEEFYGRFFTSLLSAIFSENVSGKVVVITGASSGIGEHLAYEYARRGARLALAGRRENALREVVDRAVQCGCRDVIMIVADVSQAEDCKRIVDETIKRIVIMIVTYYLKPAMLSQTALLP